MLIDFCKIKLSNKKATNQHEGNDSTERISRLECVCIKYEHLL